jgi:hypothetical protein
VFSTPGSCASSREAHGAVLALTLGGDRNLFVAAAAKKQEVVMQAGRTRQRMICVSVLLGLLGWPSGAFADESIRGVITEHRVDGTLIVQTIDSGMMVIVVNAWTKVKRDDGTRTVKVSSAALTPGLRVYVKGDLGIGNKLVADKVHFSTLAATSPTVSVVP